MSTAKRETLLVVDDEESILNVVSEYFRRRGYRVLTAGNGAQALEILGQDKVDCCFTDINMPQMNGLDFLQEVRQVDPDAAFIMITGYPSIESAVEAIRRGAQDYITKPFKIEEIKHKIDKALLEKNLRTRLRHLQGITWALIISIPLWLILGIVFARSMK